MNWTHRSAIVVVAAVSVLSLSSCGGSGESPQKVEAAKAEGAAPAAAGPREVVLDEKMLASIQLQTEEAVLRGLPVHIDANGRITPNENRSWHVGAITDARVITINVNVGDRVRKDQSLAGLHSHEIHESRANYRKARGDLSRLEAELDFATKQRDRYRRLYDLKAASLEQVQHAETQLKNAQIAVANAKIEVERTRRHLVEFLQVSAEDDDDHKPGDFAHEDDLIPVKAPAGGVVMARNVSAGSVVAPGEELFQIADLSTVWMIANVQEEHLGKLKIGMPVRVSVQAYPDQPFRGRITRLGDQLDPATRTIQVRVELANAQGRLKPEMYATAEIEAGVSEQALFIPEGAPQQLEGNTVVFVSPKPGHFVARAIQTGHLRDGFVEVVHGLSPGEKVVTNGSYILKSQLLKGAGGE